MPLASVFARRSCSLALVTATLTACPPSEPTLDAGADALVIDAGERELDARTDDVTALDAFALDTPTYPDACPPPTVLCDIGCVDIEADPDHCGACDVPCVPLAGSIPFCASYLCVRAVCRPGFGSCDGDRANGCEVDVDTSIAHCGRCDHACEGAPHASPACRLGGCALECEPGWTDCDTSVPGCECEG